MSDKITFESLRHTEAWAFEMSDDDINRRLFSLSQLVRELEGKLASQAPKTGMTFEDSNMDKQPIDWFTLLSNELAPNVLQIKKLEACSDAINRKISELTKYPEHIIDVKRWHFEDRDDEARGWYQSLDGDWVRFADLKNLGIVGYIKTPETLEEAVGLLAKVIDWTEAEDYINGIDIEWSVGTHYSAGDIAYIPRPLPQKRPPTVKESLKNVRTFLEELTSQGPHEGTQTQWIEKMKNRGLVIYKDLGLPEEVDN